MVRKFRIVIITLKYTVYSTNTVLLQITQLLCIILKHCRGFMCYQPITGNCSAMGCHLWLSLPQVITPLDHGLITYAVQCTCGKFGSFSMIITMIVAHCTDSTQCLHPLPLKFYLLFWHYSAMLEPRAHLLFSKLC